mgnify:CR=1 FL=1
MTANIGTIDRGARFLAGLLLFVAPLLNVPEIWTSAGMAYTSMGIGLVLGLTALFRFCPVYRILGISSCKL